ncbi:MAG: EAL domain-containing protein [Pseudomonadota bacterium]
MHIRSMLVLAFMITTLIPTAIFGWLSYAQSVDREFADVKDRHLIIAQNLGRALERYHTDLVGTFESISLSLIGGQQTPNIERLMSGINMLCVLIVNPMTGEVVARAELEGTEPSAKLPPSILAAAKKIAETSRTNFSEVMGSRHGGNIMLGVRRYGDKLAIAVVTTKYFVNLGKSISFGKKGHAAIVDSAGNVLAHPLPSWIEARKNIAKVSAVQRMMNGETGIEQFYSPALKGDMIAGLTSVPGPGWGVMIPQPVSELYEKAYSNIQSMLIKISVSLVLCIICIFLLARAIASPVDELLSSMRANARDKRLTKSTGVRGVFSLSEFEQFQLHYNHMVDRVTAANARIRSIAYSDSITGLPNREKLVELADSYLNCDTRSNDGCALVFVDLDDFKQVNDVHGHLVGDQFLRDCARKLQRVVTLETERLNRTKPDLDEPTVARVGGDEFAIFFPGLIEQEETDAFLKALRIEMSSPSSEMSFIAKRGASIGCALHPQHGKTLEDLMKFADIAMYHAKKVGKNNYQIYHTGIGTMTASELRLQVENAIQNDELVLEYQPKVSAKRIEVTGVEALVRWDHPKRGRISPGEWIPAISNSPVMNRLGEWVVAKAMDDQLKWQRAGIDIHVAVNVGSEHFSSPNFVKTLMETARCKSFDPRNMEIEVTEDALFLSNSGVEDRIVELHAQGFRIAIDDFGIGYSNIARLCQLPVDCLKIDRSVISNAETDTRAEAMLECIVSMAQLLDCKTVAEGVETQSDVNRSTTCGIDTLQGFHYAASMPPDQIVDWVSHYLDANDDNAAPREMSEKAA